MKKESVIKEIWSDSKKDISSDKICTLITSVQIYLDKEFVYYMNLKY